MADVNRESTETKDGSRIIARLKTPVGPGPALLAARRPWTLGAWCRVWWKAVRPFSFTASMTPVLVGSAVAFAQRQFSAVLFAAALVAAVAIHAGANLANDYYDYVRGADTPESVGPSGVIQRGLLAPRTVLRGAVVLFAGSAVLGLVLIAARGWPILLIGVLSTAAGYAYTGGPLPLGYAGLGDLVVFLFMGAVATVGAYYVQAGTIAGTAVWAAVPVAALVDAILVVNNLRDLDDDRARGKRTLATFIGRAATRVHFLLMVGAAYVSIAVGVWLQALPPLAILTVVTMPMAWRAWKVVRAEADPRTLTVHGVRTAAQLHQRVGLLLALAFVLGRY